MHYLINGHQYSVSYPDLRNHYARFCEMTDQEFMDNLPAALHLACIVCWFKGVNIDKSLSDEGVVHQLVHLLNINHDQVVQLGEIRENFKEVLRLV